MKRVAAVVLVCVLLVAGAVPVSAYYVYGEGAQEVLHWEQKKDDILSRAPNGYPYYALFMTGWHVVVFFSKKPVISIGDQVFISSYDLFSMLEFRSLIPGTIEEVSLVSRGAGFYWFFSDGIWSYFSNLSRYVVDASTASFDIDPDLLAEHYDHLHSFAYLYGAPIDTSQLEQLLSQAWTLDGNDYTPDSWNALQKVVNEAQALLDSGNYTQAEIDAMCTKLRNALNSLVKYEPLPDTTRLRALLVEAKAIDDIGYTVMSWSRLKVAITQGDNLLARTYYTQPEVTSAEVALEVSMAGLVLAGEVPTDGGRYLVDGLTVGDLVLAETAIMDNYREARKFGAFAFAAITAIYIIVRLIKKMLDFDFMGNTTKFDRFYHGDHGSFLFHHNGKDRR